MKQQHLFPGEPAPGVKLLDPCARRRDVLNVIRLAGADGSTLHDCCRALGLPPDALSVRITALWWDGIIVDSGRRREGCVVWICRGDTGRHS